ncbi:MAG: aminotransferase class I/II-fold pyridoxal phosphate-dependent enzyme [Lachnospiraceae bacterium]|nr:aminotransferase class I/II-fold pyridoxal phosphate-dependent enzyme [Lachnospiraceae bacterium]
MIRRKQETSNNLIEIQQSFGGYWRYPDMLDFCNLINPFFPGEGIPEEMQTAFADLLTSYPSGMQINSHLASGLFNVPLEFIVPGNGSAELIRSFMKSLTGITGFIRPSFEEYLNRCDNGKSVCFVPENPDMSYTDKDIIEFFTKNRVNNLILINPDNPSGNYMKKNSLLKIIKWAKEAEINLLVDESFADFADEPQNSLIDENILKTNPHLFVMKSISKSYGVPGCRLGILASGNTSMIKNIKNDVSIWNINSFGEFFLQIVDRYQKEYESALIRFRQERTDLKERLDSIPGIRIIPSEANFFMAELTDGMTASMLTQILYDEHSILIKDLTKKINDRYVRIAVRNSGDNDRLISALKSVLK